jgi:hypothetical protein
MPMTDATSSYSVEERVVQGETVWVAIRARGAEWSWLTPAEAVQLAVNGSRSTTTGRRTVRAANDRDDAARGRAPLS